jgi:4-hydroxy-tetrahydrodipicolinate synthase
MNRGRCATVAVLAEGVTMSSEALPVGIVTPLVTFFDPEGGVDRDAMTRLVDSQLDAGIHGLLAVGSTGELGGMTPSMRTAAIEIVVGAASGRAPVWAGAAGLSTAETVDAAVDAARAGADAILALPPLFFDSSDDELVRHFSMLAEAVDIPVIAYDVPPRTPRKIPMGVVVRLAEAGVLAGVKDSSGDLTAGRLTNEATAGIPGFRSYIGSEVTIDAAFVLGFDGIVPGFANVLPRPAVEIFEAWRHGAIGREAQAEYVRLFEILRVHLAHAGGPAAAINALKVGAAHTLGLDGTPPVTEPFVQPTEEFSAAVRAVVDALVPSAHA